MVVVVPVAVGDVTAMRGRLSLLVAVVAMSGNDPIEGRGGNDELYGSGGNDHVTGGGGQDYSSGDAGTADDCAGETVDGCETTRDDQ